MFGLSPLLGVCQDLVLKAVIVCLLYFKIQHNAVPLQSVLKKSNYTVTNIKIMREPNKNNGKNPK